MVGEADAQRSKERHTGRLVRRGAALALVLGGAGAYVMSALFGELQVCRDVAVQVGSRPIVEQCQPLSIVDLVPVLVIALALLLPDISEVSLPGLASVTFRLQQQEERQQELERQFAAFVQSTQVSQETNISAPNIIVVDAARVQEALPEKLVHFASVEGVGNAGQAPEPDADGPPLSDEMDARRALAAHEVLRLWDERLEPWVAIGSRYHGSRLWRGLLRGQVAGTLKDASAERYGSRLRRLLPENFGEQQLLFVGDWYEAFRQEIELVRGTRNAVAHPAQVGSPDLATLERALDIGNRIVGVVERGLEWHYRPGTGPPDVDSWPSSEMSG